MQVYIRNFLLSHGCLILLNCLIAAPCEFVLAAPRSSVLSWEKEMDTEEFLQTPMACIALHY